MHLLIVSSATGRRAGSTSMRIAPAAGRGDDGRFAGDFDRLVGIAMEFRDGTEPAARPGRMRIADMIEQQGVRHGISRSVLRVDKVRMTASLVNCHRQTDH